MKNYFLLTIFSFILMNPLISSVQGTEDLSKFQTIGYSPYRIDHNPEGTQPTIQEIKQDMEIFQIITKEIRLHDLTPITEKVLEAAKEHNLKVHLSVNMDNSEEEIERQVNKVIQLSNNYPDVVKSVILDRYDRFLSYVTIDQVLNAIEEIKNNIPENIGVTIATDAGTWNNRTIVVEKVDHLIVTSLPYWEGKDIGESIKIIKDNYDFVATKYQKSVIMETGWPSSGDSINCSEASNKKQAEYVIRLEQELSKDDIPYFLFTGFSESWKKPITKLQTTGDNNCDGIVKNADNQNAENHWGIFTVDRKINPELSEFMSDVILSMSRPQTAIITSENARCDFVFEPKIEFNSYDIKSDVLILDIDSKGKDVNNMRIFDSKDRTLLEEVQTSPPLKIILSSDTTNVFSDIMIGINCNENLSFTEIGGKKETITTNLKDFKIEMTVLPVLLASCPLNENCVDLDVSVNKVPQEIEVEEPKWWEQIEVMVGIIGTIIASIVGIITISQKLKHSNQTVTDMNVGNTSTPIRSDANTNYESKKEDK